jgi:hypothetical protein
MFERRSGDAGLEHLRPHRFKHTMVHRQFSAQRAVTGPYAACGVALVSSLRQLQTAASTAF